MAQKIPRELLWVDKKRMSEFLEEPLNKKLYEVYLNIKRKVPSQDFQTLKLFNEVYYQCCRIVSANDPDIDLDDIIKEIKEDLGWEYSTSLVVNMIYAVLSLRKGNSKEVKEVLLKIERHHCLSQYKTPIYMMTETCKANYEFYDLEKYFNTPDVPVSISIPLPSLNNIENGIHITLNINNEYTGEIKQMQVAHSDVVVGVAEGGSHVFHHKVTKK